MHQGSCLRAIGGVLGKSLGDNVGSDSTGSEGKQSSDGETHDDDEESGMWRDLRNAREIG